MEIPLDKVAIFGAGVFAGVVVGRAVQRAKFERQLLEGQVLDVSDVRGLMNPQQAAMVEALLDASGDVIAQKVGDMVTVLARVGGEQFESLFTVPTGDGSRVTVSELHARQAQRQAELEPVIEGELGDAPA